MLSYEITRLVLGNSKSLPIDESTFVVLRNSRDSLLRLVNVEEDYDIFVGNYLELERAALTIAVESFVRRRRSRVEGDQDRRTLDRLIANLLSSARAYQDHLKGHISAVPEKAKEDKKEVEQLFRAEWDSSLSYRVVDALRNYTQHRGLPIQGITYNMKWIEETETEDKKLTHRVSPTLAIEHLRLDSIFKPGILDELELKSGKSVPLLPLLREYVCSVSSIHIHVRSIFATRKQAWIQSLKEWADRYLVLASQTETIGVAAIAINEVGRVDEKIQLGLEFQEQLNKLEKLNGLLINLHKVQINS